MGAERILTLVPISVNGRDFTCLNTWLVPILKSHVVGASLGFYLKHIMPLAKSFQRASRKGTLLNMVLKNIGYFILRLMAYEFFFFFGFVRKLEFVR